MYSVEKIETTEGFKALENEWNRLLDKSEFGAVFRSFEWLYPWWELFGEEHRLYILAIKANASLIGIAPLMLTEHRLLGLPYRVVRFLGDPNCDYCDFVGEDNETIVRQVLKFLKEKKHEWAAIDLSQISEKSPSVKTLYSLAGDLFKSRRIEPVEICMSFAFEGKEADRRNFVLKRQRNFNNAVNFFNRHEGLSLEICRDADSIKEHLPRLFHDHMKRWENTSAPSKFTDIRQRRFFEILAERLCPSGLLNLVVLNHGQKPIAYLYAYPSNSIVHLYTVIHQRFYERKSPGILIFHFACEEYVRTGYDEIDFSRGAGKHKTKFINRSSSNFRFTVYRFHLDNLVRTFYRNLRKWNATRLIFENRRLRNLKERILTWRVRSGRTNRVSDIFLGIIARLAKKIANYDVTLVFSRERSTALPKFGGGLSYEQLDREQMEDIAAHIGFMENSPPHQRCINYFDKRYTCFVARYEGHIAAMLWGITGKYQIPGSTQELTVKPDEVLLGEESISPAFMEAEVGTPLLAHASEQIETQSKVPLVLCSKSDWTLRNRLNSLGFAETGRLRSLRLFGLKLF